jgi:hypothetical protein
VNTYYVDLTFAITAINPEDARRKGNELLRYLEDLIEDVVLAANRVFPNDRGDGGVSLVEEP